MYAYYVTAYERHALTVKVVSDDPLTSDGATKKAQELLDLECMDAVVSSEWVEYCPKESWSVEAE